MDYGGPIKLQQSLADEYKQRQQNMDKRLLQEIENHAVAKVYSSNKKNQNFSTEKITIKKQKQDIEPITPPPALRQNEQILNLPFEEKPQQFFRSKRSVAMRIKETYDNQLTVLEQDKLSLIQKLNDALVQLDKQNLEKTELSNKLIELIKFVRDMTRETQKCDVDIYGVVSDTLKDELKSEKELSQKLKEELKRAEMERMRILSKLNELEALRDDLEISESGMRVNYNTKTKTYEQIEDEYKDVIQRIEKCQNENDHLRALVISNRESLRQTEEKINDMMGERRHLQEKFRVLQDRYDATVETYSRERHDIDNMHDRHLRLLSTNLLFETLQEILKQNMAANFCKIRLITSNDDRIFNGMVRLRKLQKRNRAKRLRKYLNKWYTNKLKPLNNIRQKIETSLCLQARNPLMYTFYKWVLKNYLMRWRDYIKIMEIDKSKMIIQNLVKKHRSYLRSYFNKWKAVSLELDHQLKLQSMALRVAHKKYLSVIFGAWKNVKVDLKNKRYSILGRYWKNMKIYVLTRKQLRCSALTFLREGRIRQDNLIKACFDALRVHKEQEKFIKIQHELYEVEIPRKEQAGDMIQKVSQVDTEKYQLQAVNAIGKCFAKVLFKYFKKWKELTDDKREKVNSDIKQIIIQRYFMLLREAFTKWISYKGEVLINSQQEIIQIQEEENKAITSEIVQAKQLNEEKQQRQKCQSSKQMKKIVMTAFQRQLRYRFNQWRTNLGQRQHKEDETDKILTRFLRRYKRLAFNIYKNKIQMIKQDEMFEKRVEEIRFKLRERMRQRIYNAIRQFSQCHIKARNYMKRLLCRLDLSMKQNAIRKWSKVKHFKEEKQLKQQQNVKVQEIKDQTQQIGELSDQLEDMKKKNKDLKNELNKKGERIIKLAFKRVFEQSQQQYFYHWLQVVYEQKKREKSLRVALTHWFRSSTDYAYRHWKTVSSVQKQIVYTTCIIEEEQLINKLNLQCDKQEKVYYNDAEECQSAIDKEKQEQDLLIKKHQNCMQALVNRVDNKVYTKKERYILQQWSAFVQNRKRCFLLLDKAIKKTLWQVGFQELKDHSKEEKENRIMEDNTTLLFKKFWKIKLRQSFLYWQKCSKEKVVNIHQNLEQQINKINTQHSKVRKDIKSRIKEQLLQNRQYLTTFDCYIAWKNQIQSQKLIKTKTAQYKQWTIQREQLNAVQKWFNRTQATKRFRHITSKIDRVYDRSLMQSVVQSWRYTKNVDKRMCQTLCNLEDIVYKVYMKRAFKSIKLESESRGYGKRKNKEKASKFLFDKIENIYQVRMKSNFQDMWQYSYNKKKISLGQKAIVKYWFLNRIRSYFLQWKEESNRREVSRYNNEEGPVAVEVHNLKKVVNNLKWLLQRDGISPEKIEQIIAKNNQENLKKLEKGICRLFCYNDESLYLLPAALDKWKNWLQMRKMYKYWLNYLNKRVQPGKADLFHAFNKWKNADLHRKKELKAMRKEDLVKLCVKNMGQINDMDNNMGTCDELMTDLTEQRDLLLQRYVGSQKLALAVTNASCERAKQKTISRWISANYDENALFLENALKINLMRIASLKERIKSLEKNNDILAEQNEELRYGALDGIEMAKSVDDLTKEREKLSIDLADKAISIRKLLEDNHNLSVRLSNAQEEAQNLIRISQLKLQSTSAGGYGDNYDTY